MDIYSHVMPTMHQDAMDKLNQAFMGDSSKKDDEDDGSSAGGVLVPVQVGCCSCCCSSLVFPANKRYLAWLLRPYEVSFVK